MFVWHNDIVIMHLSRKLTGMWGRPDPLPVWSWIQCPHCIHQNPEYTGGPGLNGIPEIILIPHCMHGCWGVLVTHCIPLCPKINQKSNTSHAKVGPKLVRSRSKVTKKLARSGSKVGPKLTQRRPKVHLKSAQRRPRAIPKLAES